MNEDKIVKKALERLNVKASERIRDRRRFLKLLGLGSAVGAAGLAGFGAGR